MERLPDIYAGLGEDDEDDQNRLVVEELPEIREAREREREGRGRSSGHRVPESKKRYTLGELVEMVRKRKTRASAIVRSGDPDGEEPEMDEDDILLIRRQRRTR